jgi:succinoglycan biosynthesis protein ExoO
MSEVPEISVIMANYNGARHIERAIASLQAQTLQSWELIFADDASSDESVAIAERLARTDGRIRISASATNGGPAAVRNRAIALARGRWIAVFDSDDIMAPERLEALLARAQADGASIVADDLLTFVDGSSKFTPFLGKRLGERPSWIGLAEFIDSNRLRSRTPDLGYLKPMFRAEMLRHSAIRYDERLRIGEDYDLLARLIAQGNLLRLEPKPLYLYRKHPGSTSHRIRTDQIRSLIEADRRFAADVRILSKEEARALRRRTNELKVMLTYETVVELIKAGAYGRAAALSIGAPPIWPLLTRPVTARLRRLMPA